MVLYIDVSRNNKYYCVGEFIKQQGEFVFIKDIISKEVVVTYDRFVVFIHEQKEMT